MVLMIACSVSLFAEYKPVLAGEDGGVKIELDYSNFVDNVEGLSQPDLLLFMARELSITITNSTDESIMLDSLYDSIAFLIEGETMSFNLKDVTKKYPDRVFKNSKATFKISLFDPINDLVYLTARDPKTVAKYNAVLILMGAGDCILKKNDKSIDDSVEMVTIYYTIKIPGKEIKLNFVKAQENENN